MFVYDEMILSFNYTILGSYWLIDGVIFLPLIKWNLPVDYLDSYSLFIRQVNKFS